MTVQQATGNNVLQALRDANFTDSVLYYAFAQAAAESAGFMSHLFITCNNASGIVWVNSEAQGNTGAYDSGIEQPDGNYDYAAYPDLDSWARDFYRILSFDHGAGAPVNADNIPDYVTRLKTNGYFGDNYDTYLNNLTRDYNDLVQQFPEGPSAGSFVKKDWILVTAVVLMAGLLIYIIQYLINVNRMKKLAFLFLVCIMSFSLSQAHWWKRKRLDPQPAPAAAAAPIGGINCSSGPLPVPCFASYGVTQLTTYSPQLSILDSLALGYGGGIRVFVINDTAGGGGNSCPCTTQDTIKINTGATATNTGIIVTNTGAIKLNTDTIKTNTNAIKISSGTTATTTGGILLNTDTLKNSGTAIKLNTDTIRTNTTAIKSSTAASAIADAGIKLNTDTIKNSGTAIKLNTDTLKAYSNTISTNVAAMYATQTDMANDLATTTANVAIIKTDIEAFSEIFLGAGIEAISLANGATADIIANQIIVGGLSAGVTKLVLTDLSGESDLEKGMITGAIPPQADGHALAISNGSHTVTCTNVAGIIIFVLEYP